MPQTPPLSRLVLVEGRRQAEGIRTTRRTSTAVTHASSISVPLLPPPTWPLCYTSSRADGLRPRYHQQQERQHQPIHRQQGRLIIHPRHFTVDRRQPFTTRSSSPRQHGEMASNNPEKISISSAVDPTDREQFLREASELLDQGGGRWTLCNEGKGVEREFKFKNFDRTWEFMNAVAQECSQLDHHPEWSNVYNRTQIRWTTHRPAGLSRKDTHMARVCDDLARRFGEKTSTTTTSATPSKDKQEDDKDKNKDKNKSLV